MEERTWWGLTVAVKGRRGRGNSGSVDGIHKGTDLLALLLSCCCSKICFFIHKINSKLPSKHFTDTSLPCPSHGYSDHLQEAILVWRASPNAQHTWKTEISHYNRVLSLLSSTRFKTSVQLEVPEAIKEIISDFVDQVSREAEGVCSSR